MYHENPKENKLQLHEKGGRQKLALQIMFTLASIKKSARQLILESKCGSGTQALSVVSGDAEVTRIGLLSLVRHAFSVWKYVVKSLDRERE